MARFLRGLCCALCVQYYEENRKAPEAGKLLSRIENFTQYNPGLDFLLTGDKLVRMQACTHAAASLPRVFRRRVLISLLSHLCFVSAFSP